MTDQELASAWGWGWGDMLPFPGASVTEADRQQLLGLFTGVAVAGGAVDVGLRVRAALTVLGAVAATLTARRTTATLTPYGQVGAEVTISGE